MKLKKAFKNEKLRFHLKLKVFLSFNLNPRKLSWGRGCNNPIY